MIRAIAVEERATNFGQARQQHLDAFLIQRLSLASRLLPGPLQCSGCGRERSTRTWLDVCGRGIELTNRRPAPAQSSQPKIMPGCKVSHLLLRSCRVKSAPDSRVQLAV
jgi:hypothetical protein